jgi:Mn-containing catalase
MFLRVDKLQIELPQPKEADPDAAAVVQDLLGGRFGEMSTLMNYMHQSFNMRAKSTVRPYYDLIANIAAEELGHVELVANTINLMLNGGSEAYGATDGEPLAAAKQAGNPAQFLFTGQSSFPMDPGGIPWDSSNVFNSGNLRLDLLHNFFLESGARMGKIRVYEATKNPVAREMIGYLICRGGVHQEAYAKALGDLCGVDAAKLLPIPEIESKNFPHAKKFMDKGFHRFIYKFSQNDYNDIGKVWNGSQVDTGEPREVLDQLPEGGPVPDLTAEPQVLAPGVSEEDVNEIAKKLGIS